MENNPPTLIEREDDDDDVKLSAETLAALNEFYAENTTKPQEAGEITENWQLSQFWYDDFTAEALAREAIRVCGDSGRIACISCPTIYKKLKELSPESTNRHVLFEFDDRFGIYGEEFCLYDYREPLKIPQDLRNSFEIVMADPPFLSEECLTKTAVTIKFLAKDKIVLCTGAIMQELAHRLLKLNPCQFKPGHAKNLQNEFACFASYNLDSFVMQRSSIEK